MIEVPILILTDFEKTIKVNCDASELGIGNVLSVEELPIAFYHEKLFG